MEGLMMYLTAGGRVAVACHFEKLKVYHQYARLPISVKSCDRCQKRWRRKGGIEKRGWRREWF